MDGSIDKYPGRGWPIRIAISGDACGTVGADVVGDASAVLFALAMGSVGALVADATLVGGCGTLGGDACTTAIALGSITAGFGLAIAGMGAEALGVVALAAGSCSTETGLGATTAGFDAAVGIGAGVAGFGVAAATCSDAG